METRDRGPAGTGGPGPSPDGLQQLAWPLGLLASHLGQVQHRQAQALSLLLQAEAHWEAPAHQVTAVLGSGTGGGRVRPELGGRCPGSPCPGCASPPHTWAKRCSKTCESRMALVKSLRSPKRWQVSSPNQSGK